MVSSFGASHAGPVRAINEDCFLADDALSLFVVADGMGGHAAGEVASRAAVDAIADFIHRSRGSDDLSWPCGIDATLTVNGNRLRTAIYLANRSVFQLAESNDDYLGMGSTIVCAMIHEDRLTIGHAGDSRLYLLSNGVLEQQTTDDTWAASVLGSVGQAGDAEALARHPMRHVLTNVVGVRAQVDIHILERGLRDGDTLLLCSDGVHNVLDEPTLTRLMNDGCPVDAMANSMVAAAIERGTRDNLTAVVLRYTTDGSARG
jgi:serine/threonine protein phosphatase PrpC